MKTKITAFFLVTILLLGSIGMFTSCVDNAPVDDSTAADGTGEITTDITTDLADETTRPMDETVADETTAIVTIPGDDTAGNESGENSSDEETTEATTPTELPWYLVLVNPWNALPEDFSIELATVTGGYKFDARAADALKKMLADCKSAGHTPIVCSAYRTNDDQVYLYNKRVDRYKSQGYSDADAKAKAATEVAIPGTSEHQLGLAADIVCATYPYTHKDQENTPTQKWLMENCWKYGFILRYEEDTYDITGIVYEPWHYRYVGVDVAVEIHFGGITLEEYVAKYQG